MRSNVGLGKRIASLVLVCVMVLSDLPFAAFAQTSDCGLTEHTHSESCVQTQDTMLCPLTEHTHSDTCYVNMTATKSSEQETVQDGENEVATESTTEAVTESVTEPVTEPTVKPSEPAQENASQNSEQTSGTKVRQFLKNTYAALSQSVNTLDDSGETVFNSLIDLYAYNTDLIIYNYSYATDGNQDSNGYLMSTYGFSVTGNATSDNQDSVNILVGGDPNKDPADTADIFRPLTADIHLELKGLNLPDANGITARRVHPDGEYTINITVSALAENEIQGKPAVNSSRVSYLHVDEKTNVIIKMDTDLDLGEVVLGKDANLTIDTNGHNLTMTSIVGPESSQLIITGNGTVSGGSITAGTISLAQETVTLTGDLQALQTLSLSGSDLNVNGKTITAGSAITADGAKISNAALFGFGNDASGQVTLNFSNCSFEYVSTIGAADDCGAVVRFGNASAASTLNVGRYVRDYTINYYNEGQILSAPDGETWLTSYRVSGTDINGSGTIVTEDTTLPVCTIPGYNYAGWLLGSDVIFNLSTLKTMDDLSLTANLEAQDVTVKLVLGFDLETAVCDDAEAAKLFYTEKGDNGYYHKETVKLDTALAQVLPTPDRFGYNFKGWKLNDTQTLAGGANYTVALKDVDQENTVTLTAQWELVKFPLKWNFYGIDFQYIEISVDGEKTWQSVTEFANANSNMWTLSGTTITSTENGYIHFGETLADYFARLGGPDAGWTMLALRDSRGNKEETVSAALNFRAWMLGSEGISDALAFDNEGLLTGKEDDESWSEYQARLLGQEPLLLQSSFGTADYKLYISAQTDWRYQLNGTDVTIADNTLTVPNGAKVSLICTTKSGRRISDWAFSVKNKSVLNLTETVSADKSTLIYTFIMPASDVTATYSTSHTDTYIDIAKGAITFEEGYIWNGIARDGFWYDSLMTGGTTGTYQLPLLAMTPLCQVDGKYFYIWNSNQMRITSDGKPTTNQLTLQKSITVNFSHINMAILDAYKQNAVGRTLYNQPVEIPYNATDDKTSIADAAVLVNKAGSLAALGNIVLANDGTQKQTFNFKFTGTDNYIGSVFSDQFYTSYSNEISFAGTSSATTTLTLGTSLSNAKTIIKDITVNGIDEIPSRYFLYVSTSGGIEMTRAEVTAKTKEVFLYGGQATIQTNSEVDVGDHLTGAQLDVKEGCSMRVRGDLLIHYPNLSMGKNTRIVVDGNLLKTYIHNDTNGSVGAEGAVLIVKGNRCQLGSAQWKGDLLICNALVIGRAGGVNTGTVVANQIMELPVGNIKIYNYATEYEAKALTTTRYNGDGYPFLISAMGTSVHSTYKFDGGALYLLGAYQKSGDKNYDISMKIAGTPVEPILKSVLDEDGNYLEGSSANVANLAEAAVKSSNLTNNECVLLGSSTYTTELLSRKVQISGNAKIYAAGNLTFFNDVNISDNAYIWCGGSFGSKNDITMTGGTIDAMEAGIAYNLTTTLADGTRRWKTMNIGGGSINLRGEQKQLGTLSTCVSDLNLEPKGTVILGKDLTPGEWNLDFDVYINYLLGTAGFSNSEKNPSTIAITGKVDNGKMTYTTNALNFEAPTYLENGETKNGSWQWGSVAGPVVTTVTSSAEIPSEGAEGLTAYNKDRLSLYAAKSAYNVKISEGNQYITSVNGQSDLTIYPAMADQTVTISLNDADLAANKTVVWYTDPSGKVYRPEDYAVNGNNITFTMPRNDVEVLVASEMMNLDLSKYDITITKDGFRTRLAEYAEGEAENQSFRYTGNLKIYQSLTSTTQYRIRVQADVDNLSADRIFVLENIKQMAQSTGVGVQLMDGAKAEFKISGKVELFIVEVTENSDLVFAGIRQGTTQDALFLNFADSVKNPYEVALGNFNGKTGDITLKDLTLTPSSGSGLRAYCEGRTKNDNNLVQYINCRMPACTWYSSANLAQGVNKVIFDGCSFEMTASGSWMSSLFSDCNEVEFRNNTQLIYNSMGCTSTNSPTSWLYGAKKIIIDNSELKATLRHSTDEATRRLMVSLSGDAKEIIVQNGGTLTTQERLYLNAITVKDSSIVNIGAEGKGYLFANTVTVADNATVNAGTILLSGFTTANHATETVVRDYLASNNGLTNGSAAGKGLYLNGGTVNATTVGGDRGSQIHVNGGTLNADNIGTTGKVYGYAVYIPKTGEDLVYTHQMIPDSATINVQSGIVNVGNYMGGMNATVNISGGTVNIANGAVVGMTDTQMATLKADFAAKGQDIDEQNDKNITVTISGGIVTGDGINTPYGTTTIFGGDTAVNVNTLEALSGTVSIKEAKGTYEYNGLQDKMGIYIKELLTAENITITDSALVYAQKAVGNAVNKDDSGTLSVTNTAKLYVDTYGTEGEGSVLITGVKGTDIIPTNQQFTVVYYLRDADTEKKAVNNVNNPTTFELKKDPTEEDRYSKLYGATRYGFNFMGWFTSEEYAENYQQYLNDPTCHIQKLDKTISGDVRLYAAWEPKTVVFQIILDTRVQTQGFASVLPVEAAALENQNSGASIYDEEKNVLTFTKKVSVPYRKNIIGTDPDQIDMSDYDLPSYRITGLVVDTTGEMLDMTTAVITDRLLDLYSEQTGANPVLVLRAYDVTMRNREVTLELNQNEQGRPIDALFSGNTASVTAYIPIGAKLSSSQTLMNGSKLRAPSAVGYDFLGYKDENGAAITAEHEVTVGPELLLYAQWEPKVYSVLFDAGENGQVTLDENQPQAEDKQNIIGYVKYDHKIDGSLSYIAGVSNGMDTFPKAWKKGKRFLGWSLNGDKPVLTDEELNTTDFSDLNLGTGNALTLKAVYEDVTVTYKLWQKDNQKWVTWTTIAEYGEPLLGYTDVTGKTKQDNCDWFNQQTVGDKSFAIVSTTADYFQNHNYQFVPEDYRNQICAENAPFSHKGYTFQGWTTSEQSDTQVYSVAEYPVKNGNLDETNITLTAKWSANSYAIKLHKNQDANKDGVDDDETNYVKIYASNPASSVEMQVTVGQEIKNTNWPSRNGNWYAQSKAKQEEGDKRYLLGFTFDMFEPGDSESENGSPAYKAWQDYVKKVILLTNMGVLFTGSEQLVGNEWSEGTIFQLPENDEYGQSISLGNKVPDYPDKCSIDLYALYRERSLVFTEYYVDNISGSIVSNVLHTTAATEYSDYPAEYEKMQRKLDIENQGYQLIRWAVHDPLNTEIYNSANYEHSYMQWADHAEKIGKYDINVYTVYAPQVKKNLTLTATSSPLGSGQTINQEIPDSMRPAKMTYSIKDCANGLELVERSAMDPYDPNKTNEVAVELKVTNGSNAEMIKWDLTTSGTTSQQIDPKGQLVLTLHHSKVIREPKDYTFTLRLDFEGNPDQFIEYAITVKLVPTLWDVEYTVQMPEDPFLGEITKKGFTSNADGKSYTKIRKGWVYGGDLYGAEDVPQIVGYQGTAQWNYTNGETYPNAGNTMMPLSHANNGQIKLTGGYSPKKYQLIQSETDPVEDCIKNAIQWGGTDYHSNVIIQPKDRERAAYIWLVVGQNRYRLDELPDDIFHDTSTDTEITFRMPAEAVKMEYDDTLELYLDNGTIDINGAYITQKDAADNYLFNNTYWPGNYKIWQNKDNDNAKDTPNVLNIAGDLTEQTITLGNLNISGQDSIALSQNAKASIQMTGNIQAKNILVAENAELILAGTDGKQLIMNPENGKDAVGGEGAVSVSDVVLQLNLKAGAGNGISGSEIAVYNSTVDVAEIGGQGIGNYEGTWFCGDIVNISNTVVTMSAGSGGKITDGKVVNITGCTIQNANSSADLHIDGHGLFGENIAVKSSSIYLMASNEPLLCPTKTLSIDKDLQGTPSVIHITGAEQSLYRGVLQIHSAASEVTISGQRLLEVNNGDVQIDQTKDGISYTQNGFQHTHNSSYRLVSAFGKKNTKVQITHDAYLYAEDNCELAELVVEGQTTLKPLGKMTVKKLVIENEKLLTVEVNKNIQEDDTVIETTDLIITGELSGDGSFVQNGGKLTGDNTHLTVGCNMTLNGVTVAATGKMVGSTGNGDTVTTVIINGGSVTAEKIGAIGNQNDTFTFVNLENSPVLNGTLVQDHYRLNYILDNNAFVKDTETNIPKDQENNTKLLDTVLRSETKYSAAEGEDPVVTWLPGVPHDPLYKGNADDSIFGVWYYLAGDMKVAVSAEQTIKGFTQIDASLNESQLSYAEETKSNDGTCTLDLYAFMRLQGVAVIEKARNLNWIAVPEEPAANQTTTGIYTDGAWTIGIQVEGTAGENGKYIFSFENALPAGTKLTMLCNDGTARKFGWYTANTAVFELTEEDFGLDIFPEAGTDFKHNLQLCADFTDTTAPGGSVQLKIEMDGNSLDVAGVKYTVSEAPAAGNLEATADSVTVTLPGNDDRFSGKRYYLSAKLTNADGTAVSVPYDAKLKLDGTEGTWLGGDLAYFADITDGAHNWSLEGLDGTYVIHWYLTAVPPNATNIMGRVDVQQRNLSQDAREMLSLILAQISVSGISTQRAALPSLAVTITAPAVMSGGDVSFTWTKANSNDDVMVMLEKQGQLGFFSKQGEELPVESAGTVTIPAESGTYRVRFSLDGFTRASSDWDDVYFTFIVE